MSQKPSKQVAKTEEVQEESVDPEQVIAELQGVIEQKDTDLQYLLHEVKRANVVIKNLQLKIGQVEGHNAILQADLELAKG